MQIIVFACVLASEWEREHSACICDSANIFGTCNSCFHCALFRNSHYYAMRASFTACVGGGIPSPLEVNSIIYRGFIITIIRFRLFGCIFLVLCSV